MKALSSAVRNKSPEPSRRGVRSESLFLLLIALAGLGCFDLEPTAAPEVVAVPTFERSVLDGFEVEIHDALGHYQVPGAAVAVVYGDHLVFSLGAGTKSATGNQKLSEDTLFRIGTLTRPLSSSLLATLVDERRLDWRASSDGPASDGPASDGVPGASGVSEASAVPGELESNGGFVPAPGSPLAELLARAHRSRGPAALGPDPYGDLVMGALQAAGESDGAASSYRRALQERLVGPAGMVRTAVADSLSALVEDFASPHVRALDGKIELIDYPSSPSPSSTGVVSTAADLGRFLTVHLDGGISQSGKRVVSGNNLGLSREPQLESEADEGFAPLAEECCGHAGGWVTAGLGEGLRWIGAEGAIDGYAGLVGLLPERRLGLVVLANLDAGQGGRDFAREVRDAFLARVLGRAGTVSHRLDHERYLNRLASFRDSISGGRVAIPAPFFAAYDGGWRLERGGDGPVLRRRTEEIRVRRAGEGAALIDGSYLGMRIFFERKDGRRQLRIQQFDGTESSLTAVQDLAD